MLFVCSECGGTTFELIENEIIWAKFEDEVNYENDIDFLEYENVGSFKFEKQKYIQLFKEYLNRIG